MGGFGDSRKPSLIGCGDSGDEAGANGIPPAKSAKFIERSQELTKCRPLVQPSSAPPESTRQGAQHSANEEYTGPHGSLQGQRRSSCSTTPTAVRGAWFRSY